MSREALRSAALLGVPLLLAAGLFATCFERRTEAVAVGASREARANPYLALEHLLARMGREVVSLEGPGRLERLPPSDAWLVLPVPRDTLPAERSEALLDWVEGGGHLLVVTWSLWTDESRRPDPLLDRFGLQQHWAAREEDDEPEGEGAQEPPTPPKRGRSGLPEGRAVALLAWPERAEPLRLHFDPRFSWTDSEGRATRIAASPVGMHLLVIEHGEGEITALTDDWLLRNDEIGDLDHAELLVRLAGLGGRRGPVWVVTSTQWPGLFSEAVRHAKPVLVSGAVLLLFWAWRASRRFGPLRPLPPPERRRWFDHLEAAGRYHWRHDRGGALLASARECVRRELMHRRPAVLSLPPSRRDRELARLADLRPDEVARALEGAPRRPDEFTATIAQLERIRASL